MSAAGLLITFEGGEGAGKSTQVRRLAASLSAGGRKVVTTREPGGSALAEKIRSLVLSTEETDRDPLVETLLFAAARRDHCHRVIAPALKRGDVVLCDRFIDSTRAYQGAGRGVPSAAIAALEPLATGGLAPNLTLVLDLDPQIGLMRAARRRDQAAADDPFEAAALTMHQRIRQAFLAIAAAEPARCVIIAADAPEQVVARAIAGAVRSRLGIAAPE